MNSPDETRQSSSGDNQAPRSRTRSVPHPRYTLQQAEELARRAFEMGARNCDQDAVAQAVHYKNSTNGAFKGMRAAASYFGLITYKDDRYLSVSEPWIAAFHTDDDNDIRLLRQESVRQPTLYLQLIEEFAERQLPGPEKLARQLFLTPKYGILKDAAEQAARVFLDSMGYAGLIDQHNFLRSSSTTQTAEREPSSRTMVGAQFSSDVKATQDVEPAAQSPLIAPPFVPTDTTLDRIEVQLSGGRRAYLFVPVPLPAREKERLKRYIDLILEPDERVSAEDSK